MKFASCCLLFLWGCALPAYSFQSELIHIDDHAIHIVKWGDFSDKHKPTLLLLSGPIDSWHSDSAWWAATGPALEKQYNIIAIDRAGLFTNLADAPVGYRHFATDLHLVLTKLDIHHATVVSFASSNLSLNVYFADHPESTAITKVAMIDPDVLTEYAISRYQGDAQPFKDNLPEYLEYIAQGKYTPRVEQKNRGDLALLKQLAGDNHKIDWSLVEFMFAARLKINNQLNLFREIAVYAQDLDAAAKSTLPKHIPLVIIDTDFEQAYIDHAESSEDKAGLIRWAQEGREYYQQQVQHSTTGQYIPVDSQAHLFQVEKTTQLAKILANL